MVNQSESQSGRRRNDMIDKFLFGTSNPEKIARIRALLRDLSVQVVAPKEIGLHLEVEEDGATPYENAAKKATAFLRAGGLPTLSMDGGLYIDCLPPELQPGINVRRQVGPNASDDELFLHYQKLLRDHGGESRGRWVVAAVFALPDGRMETREFVDETHFTCMASPVRKTGAPLSSLQIDLDLGKYRSEISDDERASLDARLDAELATFLRSAILDRWAI